MGSYTRLALPGAGTVHPHPLSKGESGKRLRSGCENVSPTLPLLPPPKGHLQVLQVGPKEEGMPLVLRHTDPEAASKTGGWGQDEGCGQSAEGDLLSAPGQGPERS